jgi:hypothetical protein
MNKLTTFEKRTAQKSFEDEFGIRDLKSSLQGTFKPHKTEF